MNRRLLLYASLAVAVAPGVISARGEETAPPPATPASDRLPISSLPGYVHGVNRAWRLPDPSFEDVMRGGLLGLQVSGFAFDTAGNASAAVDFVTEELPGFFARTIPGVAGFEVTDESFDPLGDEFVSQTVTLALPDQDVISELLFGLVIVRKDALVQAAVGYGIEDAAAQVYDLLWALDDRWPGDDLWAMVPEQADVPVGMALEDESERGPGE